MRFSVFCEIQRGNLKYNLSQFVPTSLAMAQAEPEKKYDGKPKGGKPDGRKNNGTRVLTAGEVLEIRKIKKQGERGALKAYARKKKLPYSTVWNVAQGRTWNA